MPNQTMIIQRFRHFPCCVGVVVGCVKPATTSAFISRTGAKALPVSAQLFWVDSGRPGDYRKAVGLCSGGGLVSILQEGRKTTNIKPVRASSGESR